MASSIFLKIVESWFVELPFPMQQNVMDYDHCFAIELKPCNRITYILILK
jgi:hypothetical protein